MSFQADAVESTLGTPEGETSAVLAARLARALGFVDNWYRATGQWDAEFHADDPAEKWRPKLDALRNLLIDTLAAVERDAPFPGEAAIAAYNGAAVMFVGTYNQLLASPDQVDTSYLRSANFAVESMARIFSGAGAAILGAVTSPWFLIALVLAGALLAVMLWRRYAP